MCDRIFRFLSILFLIFYNFWIVAFWINPKRVMSTLLSGLGAQDQPYHIVFVLSDVIAGVFIILLSISLGKRVKNFYNIFFKMWKSVFFFISGFGLTTILSAIFIPKTADFEQGIPNPLIDSTQFMHDFTSILSLLLLAAAFVWVSIIYQKAIWLIFTIFFLITCIFSSLEGLFPGSFGPYGQQLNSIIVGIWLFMLTRRILRDFPLIAETGEASQ